MTNRSLACALLLVLGACSRTPATDPKVAPSTEPQVSYEVEQGQILYRHYCQTCHGDSGAGDGFNAFNLDPHPRDLGDPAFQKAKSDADLADAIRRGGSGVGLSPLMPPWGHTLAPRQIDEVVLFVRTLRKKGP
jgi:mono/diheme cytochrome c family protein